MKHINIAVFVPHAGCMHQCCFCNQRSISGQIKPLEPCEVRKAVMTALDGRESIAAELAFFGGSFTAIDRKYMLALLDEAKPFIESGALTGIRLSTRPDAIDSEVLDILESYGVSAIELGCQSMDDGVLKKCDRGHTAEDVVKACSLIKSRGFSLGVQMMTGLPGDTDETCIKSAEKLIALSPDTCRIYPTVVLENTPLASMLSSGEYVPQTLPQAVRLCSRLLQMFEGAGIRVIRLGLHSGGNVEDGYIAGAYHPAFRELCEGEIFFEKLLLLRACGTVYVPVGRLSQAVGQKRRNITRLAELGYNVTIREKAGLTGYDIETDEE